ncbi:dienelactone hydrolase family protein [Nonomuraea sp. NPDC049028]|uniref:dienelactone hydrolase family protein n=1 Tax=Nonomuraea sp. NPDC049028 TaxID=3364348 RepID=UPI003722FD55
MNIAEAGVRIPIGDVALDADVAVPAEPRGAVLFAHGSGSGRHSPRNRYVAGRLQAARLVTVLADLLTTAEERRDALTGELRFDIGLLADRVAALTDWARADARIAELGIGLFGASTGAAAALVAAAERPDAVRTVVSRGGRPDLADDVLTRVRQSTLLIVGGEDPAVIDLNLRAMRRMPGEVRLEIVPGASHLFAEPGTLEQVARLATDWFVTRL